MHDLTHLDLFSGIGGFALAARAAGFRTVGFSEVEPYACRVLAERFAGIPNIGDVRNTGRFAGIRATVLTGGFPCQPWSLAGQQRGAGDHRHLWPAMCDVIQAVGPAWVVGENVPGIISVGLEPVLLDLERLGYTAQPFVVPACAVDAQHRRERVWIVAHATGEQHQGASHAPGAKLPLANADARGVRCSGTQREAGHAAFGGEIVAHPISVRELQPEGSECIQRGWSGDGGRWSPEPSVGRVAHGVPDRAHRLKGLGNAIVPQVAERFLRFIAAIESGQT